jgi:hypothetical protein
MNASWRTFIADYPGPRAVSVEDKDLINGWRSVPEWTPKPELVEPTESVSFWPSEEDVKESNVTNNMASDILVRRGFRESGHAPIPLRGIKPWQTVKDLLKIKQEYKDMRARICRASVNRAMFVSGKGYIGLAPWNARKEMLFVFYLGAVHHFSGGLWREPGSSLSLEKRMCTELWVESCVSLKLDTLILEISRSFEIA